MPLKQQITVVLADDHTIVREGLRELLKNEADIEVIGEAENGRQAVKMAAMLNPEIIVMDIAMPLLNGLEATRQILEANPVTKIVILSAHGDGAYVAQARSIGACGFLDKQSTAHVLPEAIRRIHKGTEFYSPAISNRLIKPQKVNQRGYKRTNDEMAKLSSREMEMLQLVAEGKSNKETAAELRISIKTVEKHRQSLMNKLEIHDTAGLTRHAIAEGIIESSVQITIIG